MHNEQLLLTSGDAANSCVAMTVANDEQRARRDLEIVINTIHSRLLYEDSCQRLDTTNPLYHPTSSARLRSRGGFKLLAYSIDPKTGARRVDERGEPIAEVWNGETLDTEVAARRLGRKQGAARILVPESARDRKMTVVKNGVSYDVEVDAQYAMPRSLGSSASSWSSAGLLHPTRAEKKEYADSLPKVVRNVRTEISNKDSEIVNLKAAIAELQAKIANVLGPRR